MPGHWSRHFHTPRFPHGGSAGCQPPSDSALPSKVWIHVKDGGKVPLSFCPQWLLPCPTLPAFSPECSNPELGMRAKSPSPAFCGSAMVMNWCFKNNHYESNPHPTISSWSCCRPAPGEVLSSQGHDDIKTQWMSLLHELRMALLWVNLSAHMKRRNSMNWFIGSNSSSWDQKNVHGLIAKFTPSRKLTTWFKFARLKLATGISGWDGNPS